MIWESDCSAGWQLLIAASRPPQCNAVGLLSASHGKSPNHPHLARALVADQLRRAVHGDLGLIDHFVRAGHGEGDQALASTARIRRADNGDHADLGVSVNHLLDLAWENVEALDEHHVLFAVGDEHEAVLVEVANVARVDEAVADRPRGLFRSVAVARHHVGTPDSQLAPLAWRQHAQPGVQIHDLYFVAGHGFADRARPHA